MYNMRAHMLDDSVLCVRMCPLCQNVHTKLAEASKLEPPDLPWLQASSKAMSQPQK